MFLALFPVLVLFAIFSSFAAAHTSPSTSPHRHVHIDDFSELPPIRQIQATPAPTAWCGQETVTDTLPNVDTPHIKVIYAYVVGQPNQFAQYATLIQQDVQAAGAMLRAASNDTKSIRWDMGTSCGAEYVDIQTVVLPSTALLGDIGDRFTVLSQLIRTQLGTTADTRNFLVYADGLGNPQMTIGLGEMAEDDQPGSGNANNRGNSVAAMMGTGGSDFFSGNSDGYRSMVVLHEVSHTLGAVQNSAPNSTGAGHCTDEWDVMCYQDGGPKNTLSFSCGPSERESRYDCNQNDYFHPIPPAGSYLATHWNVYNSVFLCPAIECGINSPLNKAPVAKISGNQTIVQGQDLALDGSASIDEDGVISSFHWDTNNDGVVDFRTPQITARFTSTGSYPVQLTVIDNGGSITHLTHHITVTADTVAPSTSIKRFSPQKRSMVLKKGLLLTGTVNEQSTWKASLKKGKITLGSLSFSAKGSLRKTIKIKSRARRHVRGIVEIILQIQDPYGNQVQKRKSIKIR